MSRLRLCFMGTPDFAVASLAALHGAGHDIAAVYTRAPRPAGRGHAVQRSPVHDFALAHGLPVHCPASLRDPAEQRRFAELGLDAAVVAAYGLMLPAALLHAPRLGCLNVHASLLPRWRGAAPIQRALLAGDRETGITIMLMDEGLDTGPILGGRALPIAADATGGSLHDALAALGAALIGPVLAEHAAGRSRPRPQPAEGVTYAAKLSPAEARLDWRRPAAALERQVRAFDPWPGCWFLHDGTRIQLRAAALGPPGAATPGTVRHAPLAIACGDGASLVALQLQRPGRRALAADEFLRGYDLPAGTVLP
jgi:methionyl-tRNA formyltransferase